MLLETKVSELKDTIKALINNKKGVLKWYNNG